MKPIAAAGLLLLAGALGICWCASLPLGRSCGLPAMGGVVRGWCLASASRTRWQLERSTWAWWLGFAGGKQNDRVGPKWEGTKRAGYGAFKREPQIRNLFFDRLPLRKKNSLIDCKLFGTKMRSI